MNEHLDEGKSRRFLIIGGGVAGLELATRLGRSPDTRVTLIDSDTAHVWKPMLHAIAAGTRDTFRERVPYLSHARQHGFTYLPGEFSGLDRARKVVRLAPLKGPDDRLVLEGREIPYDVLVIAIGSRANDFGTPGVAEFCHVIDSRREADAFNLDARLAILRSLTEGASLRIAIVGGGATGVELSAELVQLLEAASAYGAPGLREKVVITLIDSGDRLLGAFPDRVSRAAAQQLQQLGVELRFNARVSEATAGGYCFQDGEFLDAKVKVWAAGVQGAAKDADLCGLETTRNGQLVVRPTLQTTVDDAVFAMGDCASLTLPGTERPLPATAQVAHAQARHLIRHLPEWSFGAGLPAFRYRDAGSIISLAKYNAFGSLARVGAFEGAFIQGSIARLGHAMLYRSHQARLHGLARGTAIWLIDALSKIVKPSVRVD